MNSVSKSKEFTIPVYNVIFKEEAFQTAKWEPICKDERAEVDISHLKVDIFVWFEEGWKYQLTDMYLCRRKRAEDPENWQLFSYEQERKALQEISFLSLKIQEKANELIEIIQVETEETAAALEEENELEIARDAWVSYTGSRY